MTHVMFLLLSKPITIATFAWLILSCAPTIALAQVDARDSARLQACIDKIEVAPLEAFEDGLVWRGQSGGALAQQCVALARIANGDVAGGATQLAVLANAADAGDSDQRALLFAKAANAWLMIEDYAAALRAANAALLLKPGEVDLLIDRARTFAGLAQWANAQGDLTLALSRRPSDALIFRLRAETYLQQGSYDAASQDVAQALLLAPREIDNYVMRGRVIEARRLGRAPD